MNKLLTALTSPLAPFSPQSTPSRFGRGLLGSGLLLASCFLIFLGGCGTDEPAAKDTSTTVDGGSQQDGVAADGEGDGDVASQDATTPDAGGTCGGLPSCVDNKGQEDLSLCPKPANTYSCEAGCCVKKEICKADADCAKKLGSAVCPDKRFTCGCDVPSGACIQTVCGVDKECPTGTLCVGGGCRAAPAANTLIAHLLRPFWLARPGDTGAAATLLGAQARTDKGAVLPTAKFTWKLSGKGFTIKDGKLTATSEAGEATVIATVVGGKASNAAQLRNLGPLATGDNLRVVAIDEHDAQPINGTVVVIGLAQQVTPDKAMKVTLKNGIATFKGVKWPADIHLISPDHDTVSVLRYTGGSKSKLGGDVVLATRLRSYADLAFDGEGKNIKAESTLIHADVIGGKVTYGGQGEAALGITSIGVGSDLLLFNLDSLIGPSVKRPFDPKSPAMINPTPSKPQDIPGGVTFMLGAPVVPTYLLAAPPGEHVVWSLAGRLGLNELLSQVSSIVSAVGDGLDVGKVVGVLLPYLSGFYSQVVMDVPFKDTNVVAASVTELDLAPNVPLGLFTTVKPDKLPEVAKEQWADLMLILAGAMLPSGELIPLGLSAASDTAEKTEKADGIVDGDPETPGNQDVEITYAPLHSGLRVGSNNHILITAAVNVGGGGRREGGSIIFSDVGPLGASVSPGPFLAYAKTSSYDPTTRELSVSAVAGAQFYRAVLTGSQARRWQVLLATDMAGKTVTLPDLTTWGATTDLGKAPKRAFIGAFELRTPRTFVELFAPDGMIDLVRQVRRTSFIDVVPPKK